MWIFGLVFVSFVALMGVIWTMLLGKIKDNEDDIKILKVEVKSDMKKIDGICNEIFQEIKEIKDGFAADRVHAVETFARKEDCIRTHAGGK